jgi:ferredoxin
MDWLSEAPTPADRVVVACCGPAELFREAASGVGLSPDAVEAVNLREACFWPHGDGRPARAKAIRLLAAAMSEGTETPRPPALRVRVGSTVLVAAEAPAGLTLARRLGELARPVLILDERSSAFDAHRLHPLPVRANWGRVVAVEGTLGAFRVTVEHQQPIDLRTCIACQRCVPVCHTAAITPALRLRLELCDRCGDCLAACAPVGAIRIPRAERELIDAAQVVVVTEDPTPPGPLRTGHHHLSRPGAADLDAVAWRVATLTGEFQRPQYVVYEPSTCAGGAAGRQACGRCLPACPYRAIHRDPHEPLRVRVDQLACEGCGACVAACPTGALAFTEPPPTELGRRLGALLAPRPGVEPLPLVVAFHCPVDGARALAEAGRGQARYPATVLPVPMACLRHVGDADVLRAFRHGAAGVALLGCVACPHGERELLIERLELVGRILDALGLGRERVHVITGTPEEALGALTHFSASLPASPVVWDGSAAGTPVAREAVAEALGTLMAATGREPGRLPVPASAPYAFPEVRIEGCTLCRTCVNVCPTHAFRFDESRQALELRQVACVNCGLCATACPEGVITLRAELYLDRSALDWVTVVEDEPVRCVRCGTPFGTRRALEAVEARVLGLLSLGDTFAGPRRNLLRMCPTCRGAAAVLAVQEGWEP